MAENKLRHIAFIMDGNGRWAKARGHAREYGHKYGMLALEKILGACRDRGIQVVTVYAFSTENWKRPQTEVGMILRLFDSYVDRSIKDAEKNRIAYHFLGDRSPFSQALQEKMSRLERMTAHYPYVFNIAVNYGGRAELVHAFNTLMASGKKSVTEEDISGALYTAHCGDPDLIVRTGGEHRLSNFLTWQSVYAEFYSADVLWPDFDEAGLDAAIENFMGRSRRYGGV